jgi:hypothetical protein
MACLGFCWPLMVLARVPSPLLARLGLALVRALNEHLSKPAAHKWAHRPRLG